MCRLLVYYGDPILLASSVLWPERSIIKQSYDARERLLDPTLPAHLGAALANLDPRSSSASTASTPMRPAAVARKSTTMLKHPISRRPRKSQRRWLRNRLVQRR